MNLNFYTFFQRKKTLNLKKLELPLTKHNQKTSQEKKKDKKGPTESLLLKMTNDW